MRGVPAPKRPRVLRRFLLTIGILPALVALVVLTKVVVMMGHDEDGRAAFSDADFASAADEFGANRTWNWFEPWVAPFDQGAARHADGGHDEAVNLYELALETVPEVEECTVRINLALAHEALGDRAAEGSPPDPDLARQYWQAGVDALAAGGCPQDSGRGAEQTQDAEDVDQRLRQKLRQQEQQQQQDRQGEDEQPSEGDDSRQQELEERNDEGREDRTDQQDGGGGGPRGGSGGTPQPGW